MPLEAGAIGFGNSSSQTEMKRQRLRCPPTRHSRHLGLRLRDSCRPARVENSRTIPKQANRVAWRPLRLHCLFWSCGLTQRSSRILREGRRDFVEAACRAAIASFKASAFDQAQASPATGSTQGWGPAASRRLLTFLLVTPDSRHTAISRSSSPMYQ